MRSIEWRYFIDVQWLQTTPNRPIFDILYRLSYLRSGWRYRVQIW